MNRVPRDTMKKNSQELRKNMTKEERHLWYDFLKPLNLQFHRQKVFADYVADFYCASKKLIIELDGGQHYEESGKTADKKRDAYFSRLGITVLRYSNEDVNRNFRGVCEDILRYL